MTSNLLSIYEAADRTGYSQVYLRSLIYRTRRGVGSVPQPDLFAAALCYSGSHPRLDEAAILQWSASVVSGRRKRQAPVAPDGRQLPMRPWDYDRWIEVIPKALRMHALYVTGSSLREIGRDYGLTRERVRQFLETYTETPMRPIGSPPRAELPVKTLARLISPLLAVVPRRTLCRVFEIPLKEGALRREGLSGQQWLAAAPYNWSQRQRIVDLWNSGEDVTMKMIADHLGLTLNRVGSATALTRAQGGTVRWGRRGKNHQQGEE